MSDAVRAFIALPVADSDREPLLRAQKAMKERAEGTRLSPRWIKPEQMHLTIKFLGQVPPEKLPELSELMKWHATKTLLLETHWSGIIAFGGPRRAGALVAGVDDEEGHITDLAARLDNDCKPLGIEPEKRAFRAHVTLARVKPRSNVVPLLEAATLESTPVRFDEMRLYESRLTPDGGVYSVLAREPLTG